VSHDLGFLRFRASDALDFHPGKFATVTDGPVITFAPFVFERDHFFVFALLDYFGGNFSFTVANVLAINVHQHFERRRFARFDIQKIDIHRVAFRDAILPSTGLDDCVSHNVFSGEKKPRKISQKGRSDKQRKSANPSPAASHLPLPGQGED
jgi:hypothetical protein